MDFIYLGVKGRKNPVKRVVLVGGVLAEVGGVYFGLGGFHFALGGVRFVVGGVYI